jgi:adenylate kinase family enzyme
VREPLTEELLNELLSSPDPNSFLLSANPSRRSLAEYLQQLLDEKGLERSKVVREAE